MGDENISSTEQATTGTQWTFAVYFAGDNSLDSMVPLNLSQIQAGLAANPAAPVKVIALVDRLGAANDGLYEVTAAGTTRIVDTGEILTSDPATLTSFIQYVAANYPAQNLLLDIWNHGGGFRGCCVDDSAPKRTLMSPAQVKAAIAAAGKPIQVLGFDACLMGMGEVVYELKGTADFLVGSELLVPGWGWAYTPLMAYLATNPSTTSRDLSQAVVDTYLGLYDPYNMTKVQMVAVDMTRVDAFAQSLSAMSNALLADLARNMKAIADARGASKINLQNVGTKSFYYYSDVQRFAEMMAAKTPNPAIAALAQDLLVKLNALVIYERHDARYSKFPKLNGLSIYFPVNDMQDYPYYASDVPAFAAETTWYNMVLAYLGAKK
jgi:hypothetical protein